MLAIRAPAFTSSRIMILIEQPLAQFENVGHRQPYVPDFAAIRHPCPDRATDSAEGY
jgi:hypothetical protein